MARFAKLATIGLCSGALVVGGVTGASAESDSENVLQKARAAGIGKTASKAATERAAPDVRAPFSAQDLVADPDFLVFDFYPDHGDGSSVPSVDSASLSVHVDYPDAAVGVSSTDVATAADMTNLGGMAGLELDVDGDSDTDLLSLTPDASMAIGDWWVSTFGKWNGTSFVDSGIPVYWMRDTNAYVVSFDWGDLPKTKVSWVMGIEDEFGGEDYAPDDFGEAVELDKVAPNTKITSGTSGKVDSRTAKFYFKSTEAGSTFRCRLDGGSWRSCASPKSYTRLPNGDHKFRVRATDKAGNTDPTPAIRNFITAKRIKVALKAKDNRSKLGVDVDPNLKKSNYKIKVQKRKSGKWKTVLTTRTKGPKDRRTINMGKGKYRIRVPGQFHMFGAKSNSVWLKR